MDRLHFISGLPRSGSTLLAAILRQNPRFHAGMSSPVNSILSAMRGAISRKNEAALFLDQQQKRRLLRSVFTATYRDSKTVVFDTNHGWTAKLPLLMELFPSAKLLCCVRDIAWIMDSIERAVRSNPFDLSGIFGYDPNGNVFDRVSGLAAATGMVGFALNSLREAVSSEHAVSLMLIEYEALCRNPGEVMQNVYRFIGEKPFKHDFDNVEYDADAFDRQLGTPGLHTVRRKVEWRPRPSCLPPALFSQFDGDQFWRDEKPLAVEPASS